MLFPKSRILRAESYRRYVASFPCFACGTSAGSQAAHANKDKALGMKVCDSKIFPLCATSPMRVGCHDAFDLGLDMTRDERRELEAQYVERMQAQAARDGWVFGPTAIQRETA